MCAYKKGSSIRKHTHLSTTCSVDGKERHSCILLLHVNYSVGVLTDTSIKMSALYPYACVVINNNLAASHFTFSYPRNLFDTGCILLYEGDIKCLKICTAYNLHTFSLCTKSRVKILSHAFQNCHCHADGWMKIGIYKKN